jgi:hypothetical protein
MPAYFGFSRYKLQKGDAVVLETDFSERPRLTAAQTALFLGDLLDFPNHKQPGYVSEATIDFKGEQLTLTKPHDANQVQSSNAAAYTELAEYFKAGVRSFLPSTITAQHLTDLLSKVDLQRIDLFSGLTKLKQDLTELGGEVAQKLLEVEENLANIDSQINQQRQADDAQLTIGQLEAQITEIDQKLVEVDKLLEHQSKLQTQLQELTADTNSFAPEKVAQMRAQIEQTRIDQLQAMQTAGSRTAVKKSEAEQSPKPNVGSQVFWGVTLLTLVVAGISYVLVRNPLSLILAVLAVACIYFLYRWTNSIPQELALEAPNAPTAKPEVMVAAQTSKPNTSDVEKYFIDKAWYEVYQAEITNLNQVIKAKLGDEDHLVLKQLQTDLQAEIADLQKTIANQKTRELTPEKYLAARRELETLKVEKARLDNDLLSLENKEQLTDLRTQLELLSLSNKEYLELSELIFKITGYKSLKWENNQLQGLSQDDQWVGIELTIDQIKQLVAVLTAENWLDNDSEVQGPLILVDWDKSLPRVVKKQIDDRIGRNKSEQAQVIFINTV